MKSILISGINGFVGTNFTYVVEQLIVKENMESGIYHVGDDEPLSEQAAAAEASGN
jgi:hypothetical protein